MSGRLYAKVPLPVGAHASRNLSAAYKGMAPVNRVGFETMVILVVSSAAGYLASWFLDWYAWQHDILILGNQTMYLQQATESWILGTSIGITVAICMVYAFIRLHAIRGD